MKFKGNRTIGFIIITIIYILATGVGLMIFYWTRDYHLLIRLLLADVAATIFVYIGSVIFDNSSVYDPYWSAAPVVILFLLTGYFQVFSKGVIILLVVVSYWGIRLTINWAYTFKSLNIQDWRYDLFKTKSPRYFQLINLIGIHMFPTLIVYCALIPAIVYIQNSTINFFTLIGFMICIGAATLQLVADYQMHIFRKLNNDKSKYIHIGLWKYSRHPNYFGEILMWWGIYFIMLSSNITLWYLFIGAFLNTLLFLKISIPMAENRLRSYKDNFEEYMISTRRLIPLPYSSKTILIERADGEKQL